MVDEEPCFLFSFHAINIRHFRKTIEKRRKKRTKKKKKSKNIPSGNPALQSKSLSWSCKRKQKNSSTRFKWRYTHPILNKDQKQEISTNRQVGLRNKAGQWIPVVWLRKMASGEKKKQHRVYWTTTAMSNHVRRFHEGLQCNKQINTAHIESHL